MCEVLVKIASLEPGTFISLEAIRMITNQVMTTTDVKNTYTYKSKKVSKVFNTIPVFSTTMIGELGIGK